MHEQAPLDFREKLRAAADAAYCKGCQLSKRAECLGEESKLERGTFGAAELAAHRLAAEQFGFHKLAYDLLNRL